MTNLKQNYFIGSVYQLPYLTYCICVPFSLEKNQIDYHQIFFRPGNTDFQPTLTLLKKKHLKSCHCYKFSNRDVQIQVGKSRLILDLQRPFIQFPLQLFHYSQPVGDMQTASHAIRHKENNIQGISVIFKQLKDFQNKYGPCVLQCIHIVSCISQKFQVWARPP